MEAVLQATAVDTTVASGLVYEALAAQVPPGFTLVPGNIQYQAGEVLSADEQGRVTFLMNGEGAGAADLPLDEVLPMISGQEPETAVAYLFRQLPLRDPPAVRIWPLWSDRLPYLPGRIQVDVRLDG